MPLLDAPFSVQSAHTSAVVRAHWINAKDGIRLRVARWPMPQAGKGTVLLFPGRTEYVEKLDRTALELNHRGFGTFAIDWRGQGLSDRLTNNAMTSHVSRFTDYQLDVAAMTAAAADLDLPKPWFLLGHSMGAAIGLRALAHKPPFSAAAFTAPMWDLHLSKFERLAIWPISAAASTLGAGHNFAPGNKAQQRKCYVLSVEFDGNRLTSDPEMFAYMADQAQNLPAHQIGAPSMRWVFETLKELRALRAQTSPAVPCAIFCGDRDVVINIDAAKDRVRTWPNAQFEVMSGARHDLMSELPSIRSKIFDQIQTLFAEAAVAHSLHGFSN